MADDDLKLLMEACQEFDQPISIRGSTAYMMSKLVESDFIARGSIVESVPPLGDLDLIVYDTRASDAMENVSNLLERFKTYVPYSRFIHVDVFYDRLPVRNDSPLGNVKITGLPEISIAPDKQNDDKWTAVLSPVDRPVQAEILPRVPAGLFRDFLFLLRLTERHPGLNETTREVAGLLARQDPLLIGLATRHIGGAKELARVDRALVKHAMLHDTETRPASISDYFPRDWLLRFATQLNHLSQTILLPDTAWQEVPCITYAVNGEVMTFAAVSDLDSEEKQLLEAKLGPESDSIGQRLTPSIRIVLPNPDDPECCDYTDFSKGVSELAFRDLTGGPLLNVALIEGREKYYAVHAQASEGFGARSLRTDPGFMATLNHGLLGSARILGVKKE